VEISFTLVELSQATIIWQSRFRTEQFKNDGGGDARRERRLMTKLKVARQPKVIMYSGEQSKIWRRHLKAARSMSSSSHISLFPLGSFICLKIGLWQRRIQAYNAASTYFSPFHQTFSKYLDCKTVRSLLSQLYT
jgi:hypothetical protein